MEEVCMENAAYQLNTKIIPIFFVIYMIRVLNSP